jgi:hypothetical protein
MNKIKFLIVTVLAGAIFGCAPPPPTSEKLPSSYALKGTNTALVGIALDDKGFPVETVKEVVLKPGQKVFFAGPDSFLISFKKQKAPNESIRYESEDGVIAIVIPEDILERPEFVEEYRKNKFLRFDYAINVNGKELDPPMIIRRDD